MAKKGNKGSFGIGRKPTGRPKGVPNKATAVIRELAQPYSQEAIDTLVALMRKVDAPDAARIAACRELLDRGHGKPREVLRHEGLEPAKLAVVNITSREDVQALLGTGRDVEAGDDVDDDDDGA